MQLPGTGVGLDRRAGCGRPGSVGEVVPRCGGGACVRVQGLIGCGHGLEHPFDQKAGRGWGRWPPSSKSWPTTTPTAWPTPPWPNGSGCCDSWWSAWKATGWPTRRRGRPRGRRRRTGRPGRLHRRLAPGSAAHECRHRRQHGADRPGAVPRPPDRHRPGPDPGDHLPGPCPGAGPRHPGPARPVAAEAEPVLVEAARRLDPPRLRRAIAHLRLVADPDGADAPAERRHQRRGCGCRRPGRAWSPSRGCWTLRPARPCWRPWSRWPAPPRPGCPLWWPAPG